ncbi:MAG: hypothetical protein WC465_00065 [Patescibacteria group bacterium]
MLQNSKTCPHCRQTVPYQAKYCSNCGAKFIAPTPDILLKSTPPAPKISTDEAKKLEDESDRFQVG